MEIDKLLTIMNHEIDLLKKQVTANERKAEEIKQLEKIITTIQNNPFKLCNLDEKTLLYIITSTNLDGTFLDELNKYKIIYECWQKFGSNAVPQITIVNDFVKRVSKTLDERKCILADDVANCQYELLKYRNITKLRDELSDPERIVSEIDTLSNFLDKLNIDILTQIAIKGEINTKNNRLYINAIKPNTIDTVRDCDYNDEIDKIKDKLEQEFNQETLKKLNAISDLLSSCKTNEEKEQIIESWKVAFGDNYSIKVIDALITIKNIDKLIINSLEKEGNSNYSSDIESINEQIQFLEEYKKSLEITDVLEKSSLVAEVREEFADNKIEQILRGYNADPLSTSNCVLFLSDRLSKDIEDIRSRETLEDAFVLIEQLKNNKIDSSKKLTGIDNDLYQLKPSSKGRQARVVYTKLSNNIYGVLHIYGKKSDNPKSRVHSIESRRKNCDIDSLKKHINDPEVFDYYVDKTKKISENFYNIISGFYGTYGKAVSGGVK